MVDGSNFFSGISASRSKACCQCRPFLVGSLPRPFSTNLEVWEPLEVESWESKGTHHPPNATYPPKKEGLISKGLPSSPNKALLRPYFLRGWHWGGQPCISMSAKLPLKFRFRIRDAKEICMGRFPAKIFRKGIPGVC